MSQSTQDQDTPQNTFLITSPRGHFISYKILSLIISPCGHGARSIS